ncbi:MAG: hypothetical protein KDB03_11455 [Planctomycetales bacterium]|nr:hypothetical protein [Planctomycetales bacterium]
MKRNSLVPVSLMLIGIGLLVGTAMSVTWAQEGSGTDPDPRRSPILDDPVLDSLAGPGRPGPRPRSDRPDDYGPPPPRSGGPRGMDGPPPPPPRPRLEELLDANHDDVIDADEIAAAVERLQSLDENGDGQLSHREYCDAPPPPPMHGSRPDMRPEGGPPHQGGFDGPPPRRSNDRPRGDRRDTSRRPPRDRNRN